MEELNTIDHELGAIVCARLSHLMRDERALKGRSIRTLARKLKIKRRDIKKWESGDGCPPGPVMIAIFQHYGTEAFGRLLDLDFDLQMLKYQRTLSRKSSGVRIRKVPAVIWAELEQFTLAA